MIRVFISGSISIKTLPNDIKSSIKQIASNNMEIIVGDADGIDSLVQKYCNELNYNNLTVYTTYSIPRNIIEGLRFKQVIVDGDIKKERARQAEKDKAMTLDSDFSLVVWDGKSKGSYNNILRALDNGKKVKLYLSTISQFIETKKVNKLEVQYIYRNNVGYSASEIIEYLKGEGEDFFNNTRSLNQFLLDHKILMRENSVYKPYTEYENLFIVERYRGKETGVRFQNEFISWIEKWLKNNKPPTQNSLF